ncbi:PorT family protein [Hymenobacter sp. 15J16-1T3B]|uniref:PorT family protein n=1 Tax=Hymenobacter sp. 15J16-1T3B TaxID=2886941 RepID=UPI001D1199EB|nr:PorT family protein [Hymenobacter sp. 15J16-1T3B]MCC3156876.1 PorT family protein [Hymenobacter sp. 15J16-1T3B]
MRQPLFLLLLGLAGLPFTAVAQRPWHLGLAGGAASGGFTNLPELTFSPVNGAAGPGQSYGLGADGSSMYHLGLQLSGELTDRLTLEMEPRYWRLRYDFHLTLGQAPYQGTVYSRVLGGAAQLPVGLRWRLGRAAGVQPHLLARAVPGLAQTAAEPAWRTNYDSTPSLLGIGFSSVGLHWQLGLEGGVGVLVRQRVGLNLLYHHGFRPTRLVRPSALLLYQDPAGGQYLYTANGLLTGRLNALSLQAVAYFN